MLLVIKPGKGVTYNEELTSIKSDDSFITWFCDFDFSENLTENLKLKLSKNKRKSIKILSNGPTYNKKVITYK